MTTTSVASASSSRKSPRRTKTAANNNNASTIALPNNGLSIASTSAALDARKLMLLLNPALQSLLDLRALQALLASQSSSRIGGATTSTPDPDPAAPDSAAPNALPRTNKLGGKFVNGRPLPDDVRRRVTQLHDDGARPCEIASQLKLSHGCVSKILKRYKELGTFKPAVIGGSKPRVSTPDVAELIVKLKAENSILVSREIRAQLATEHGVPTHRLPSISSINRILRNHSEASSSSATTNINRTTDRPSPQSHRRKRIETTRRRRRSPAAVVTTRQD